MATLKCSLSDYQTQRLLDAALFRDLACYYAAQGDTDAKERNIQNAIAALTACRRDRAIARAWGNDVDGMDKVERVARHGV